MHLRDLNCCAVKEIAFLKDCKADSKRAIASICRSSQLLQVSGEYLVDPDAFYIFTATAGSQYGNRMAAYILEHNLGEIVESLYKRNKNSGNRVKVWVWAVNKARLRAWWKEHRK